MRYGSVCSGIEAATAAWHPLGWTPAWFSEIEPFPCRLLQHHYPAVPNLGDMLKIRENEIFQGSTINLLVGGTPCQSFSIAGLRGGLTDDRGNLALEFCRILAAKRPRWFVWENVPGVFSSFSDEKGSSRVDREGRTDGREFTETADFAAILAGFSECGYSVSWRVLDAQFFGVPQRRRRVFVVGYLGDDWRPPAAVLFEPESMRRDIKTSGKKGKSTAAALTGRPYADNESREGHSTLVFQHKQSSAGSMNPSDICPTLHRGKNPAVMYSLHGSDGTTSTATESEVSTPLRARAPGGIENCTTSIVQNGPIVRCLTPMECERLQGFPDQYTGIKGAKNSPRYSAIGNSMAIPVMAWIGRRIDIVDRQIKSLQ